MSIYQEIQREREYQTVRWGDYADDTVNAPNDFVSYIANHATRWLPGSFAPFKTETVDAFRKQMIKVAALAVAAVESIDRQRYDKGRTFYEAA